MNARIYVASLADYNAGRLHGVWVDLTDKGEDEVWEEIENMLSQSDEQPAEEWAIHDHEGLPEISEWESIESVMELARLGAEYGEAYFLRVDDVRDYSGEQFEDEYCGCWESEKEFAQQFADDMGHTKDNPLEYYIDWDAYTRDLMMDYSSYEGEEGTHIFRDS